MLGNTCLISLPNMETWVHEATGKLHKPIMFIHAAAGYAYVVIIMILITLADPRCQ